MQQAQVPILVLLTPSLLLQLMMQMKPGMRGAMLISPSLVLLVVQKEKKEVPLVQVLRKLVLEQQEQERNPNLERVKAGTWRATWTR